MLAEKRYEKILEIVNKERSVTVQELMKTIGISESTVRRDLNSLDAEGRLVKVHGGAIAVEGTYTVTDAEMHIRQELNSDEKDIIAKYASTLIEENDFVYLDAGSTTEKMIDYITVKNAVFVTNAWSHAKRLSQKGYVTYILGGEFKVNTEAVVGSEALESLRKYNFTKGFFGANGITMKEGFSTPDVKEAAVKSAAMRKCRNSYVIADNSKFFRISPISFEDFGEATIITTGEIDRIFSESSNVLEV